MTEDVTIRDLLLLQPLLCEARGTCATDEGLQASCAGWRPQAAATNSAERGSKSWWAGREPIPEAAGHGSTQGNAAGKALA